jgi:dTDP-4-amino-4,6-dideoxygalactose transaminase
VSLLRPIHHTFAPHADARQCGLALKLLFQPWKWKKGDEITAFRAALAEHCDADVSLFSNGREALYALLHALHIGAGDEVIVQAYTCVVVVNAIRATGATPVFVDIEKSTLGLDCEELRRAMNPKVKAVICQHTFGLPSPLADLRAICDAHRVPLIEDCAHVLPDDADRDAIGTIGDFALLSFGRDKAISGVTGGAIVSHRTDVSNRISILEKNAVDLSHFSIKRLLSYPITYAIARPLYGIGIGKVLLKLASMLGLLPAIVTADERRGKQSTTVHALPNACAALALQSLRRLRAINDHRRALTTFYLEACATHGWPVLHGIRADLPLQKFPIFFPNAEAIRRKLKPKNIHLHDGWTGCVICPASVDAAAVGYDGQDPNAEKCGEQIFSLPTHPTMTLADARRLVAALVTVQSPQ